MKARQHQKAARRMTLRQRDGMSHEEAAEWAAIDQEHGCYVRPLRPGGGGKVGTRRLRDAWICRMGNGPEAEVRRFFDPAVIFRGPAWECVRRGLRGEFDAAAEEKKP